MPLACPAWYLYTTDATEVRLLTDGGAPSPEPGTEPARTLAELTAAIHAAAYRLCEHELRHLELPSRCSAGAAET